MNLALVNTQADKRVNLAPKEVDDRRSNTLVTLLFLVSCVPRGFTLFCPAQVFPFEQLARLRSLPEEYEIPEPKPFKPRVDPSSWLADEQHRDQFVLRYSEPHASGKLVRRNHESMLSERDRSGWRT